MNMMARKRSYALAMSLFLALVLAASTAAAHCEIPCGIYDDQMRTEMIAEDAATVEKSMKMIDKLSKEAPVNYNQLVRWITNKEEHANKIQHVVTQYFMTQRIAPDTDNYEKKVEVLHKLLVAAMKCKQTTDLTQVETLRTLLKEFEALYFGHTHRK